MQAARLNDPRMTAADSRPPRLARVTAPLALFPMSFSDHGQEFKLIHPTSVLFEFERNQVFWFSPYLGMTRSQTETYNSTLRLLGAYWGRGFPKRSLPPALYPLVGLLSRTRSDRLGRIRQYRIT